MGQATTGSLLQSLWDEGHAAGLDEAGLLLYRSNLLGSDKRITNYGGGNTSAKTRELDPLTGEEVDVLWVKGSGGDLGTIRMDGFATLYRDKLNALKSMYRGVEFEDEMVGYLPHCTFNLNPRAASIDTPLHAFVPHKHVDHMHPDAVIAIAAAAEGEALTAEIYGNEIGWLPWKRPGFELGLWIGKFANENPDAKGVVLGGHGLFTWGPTALECYDVTLDIINRAIAWLDQRTTGVAAFGGAAHNSLSADERKAVAARLMPRIRGRISDGQCKIGHFDDSDAVLEFVNAKDMPGLAALGTSCPDHFLRTKIRPLVIDFDPAKPDLDATVAGLDAALEAYRKDYAAYYERCKHPDSPAMRDPNAVVYLVPGVGMITFAKDKATARVSAEFYINAINVMCGASAVSTYQGLDEQEAFDIEYWLLEEAKLQRMPKPKSLAGRVAFISGAAGGIGKATAARLAAEGACVVLGDLAGVALDRAADELCRSVSHDVVRAVPCDVTSEDAVAAAFAQTCLDYGGVDIVVSNAGVVTGAAVEDTTLDQWQTNMDVLSTGYFLVSREAFRLMKTQGQGGSIVFVASKNALAASVNAAAYCAAKASEIHLARCLALEGAPHKIRVNVVNPDAVLRGSRMWSDERREERAAAYAVAPDELDTYYRDRSLLKESVYPEDIAEGIYFFASDLTRKSTANVLNIDAGNAVSFPR